VIRTEFSERRRRRPKAAERKDKRSAGIEQESTSEFSMTSSVPAAASHDVSKSHEDHYHYYQKSVKKLLKVAHILHYCSIAILGIFVIQVYSQLLLYFLKYFQNYRSHR